MPRKATGMADFDGSNLEGVSKRLHDLGKAVFAVEKKLPVLEKNSDPWRAWKQWRKDHGLPVGFMKRQDRWTVPAIWPPASEEAFLALEREWAAKAKGGVDRGVLKRLAT